MQIHPTSTNVQSNPSYSSKNSNRDGIRETSVESNSVENAHLKTSEVKVQVEEFHKSLENFNKIFKPTHLEFKLHEESGKYFVTIIDDKTQDVIKQIPSDEFLEMVAAAKEQSGVLIDKRI